MEENKRHSYKGIISDFDGTLSGPDFHVSERVKEAIRAWQASKRHFSIATGKVFPGIIEKICQEIGLTDPIITSGGAQIIHPITGKILHAEYIDKVTVLKLIEAIKGSDILYEIQTENAVYASSSELKNLQKHKHYEDFSSFTPQDALFVRLITTGREQSTVKAFTQENIAIPFSDVSITASDTPYSTGVNIAAKNATKQMAVITLAQILKIDPQTIIGIGDGYNDINLLHACGYKVAMHSSPDELKAIADEVIPDFTHDGVADFINQMLSL